MARLIATKFPLYKDFPIADVAGGKGYLKASLFERGFRKVTTIDKRHHLAKGRPGQKYAYFTSDSRDKFALVAGMHPDEATDHIVLYAVLHGIPFAVCPCCVKPSAKAYTGKYSYLAWLQYLKNLATRTHTVEELRLPMAGRNIVLVGIPKR
jgi:hypothetical protein